MNTDDIHGTNCCGREKRLLPRYTFGLEQQIAEIQDGALPSPDAFESVRCVDISRGGFAFYRKTLPASGEIVIALGEPPDLTYLTARIVQSATIDRYGHTFFRIGCQFNDRVEVVGDSLVRKRHKDLEAAFQLMANPTDESQLAREERGSQ